MKAEHLICTQEVVYRDGLRRVQILVLTHLSTPPRKRSLHIANHEQPRSGRVNVQPRAGKWLTAYDWRCAWMASWQDCSGGLGQEYEHG